MEKNVKYEFINLRPRLMGRNEPPQYFKQIVRIFTDERGLKFRVKLKGEFTLEEAATLDKLKRQTPTGLNTRYGHINWTKLINSINNRLN